MTLSRAPSGLRIRIAARDVLALARDTGSVRQVLIESDRQGRTEHFLPVAIAGEKPGVVMAMMITGKDDARLTV